MAVYVDGLFVAVSQDSQAHRVGSRTGHRWCHMMADTDEELHFFAEKLGLRREWFQGDHYDLTPGKRRSAVKLGAVEVTIEQLIEKRRKKREAR